MNATAAIGSPLERASGRIVLAVNKGSSSLKFGLYRVSDTRADPLLADAAEGVAAIAAALEEASLPVPQAVGHRVVHGGPELRAHCRIDDHVMVRLEAATPFAPLHGPLALEIIRATQRSFPGVPQMACFDTAFHATLPDIARVLPIPKAFRTEGVERYGFHGLSCESVIDQLTSAPPHRVPQRVIIAHLGSGASVTAVHEGRSIDTTMGLTPSGGVIMGTRAGDLDPGLLLYLLREKHFDVQELAHLIDRRSGLLAISGLTSDMRTLREAALSNTDARLAIGMFCRSASKQIAAMAATLNGLDLLVFTGGIGENDAHVRAAICTDLAWMGVCLDDQRNANAHDLISASGSRPEVRVVPAREEQCIARHARLLMA